MKSQNELSKEYNLQQFVLKLRKLREQKEYKTLFDYEWKYRKSRESFLNDFPEKTRNLVEDGIRIVSDMSAYEFLKEAFQRPLPPNFEFSKTMEKNRRNNEEHLKMLEQTKEEREDKLKKILYNFRGIKRRKTIDEMLEISNERLLELHKRIKPVWLRNGKLVEIIGNNGDDGRKEYFDHIEILRNISFIWSPIYGKERKDLIKLCRITTWHSCGYVGFFKPSIAEVLAQIPKRYIQDTLAYETGRDDKDIEGSGSGTYHTAKTILYTKR